MEDWKYQPARDFNLQPSQRRLSLERETRLTETISHLGWWGFIRAYLKLYHRMAIEGREHLPKRPPFVMIANHTSHLDAMVLSAPLSWRYRDRVFPIAAGDVFFETPVMTHFAVACINALPMWRRNCGPHALKELRRRLVEEPCGYILFPEGARTRDGELLPFKAGLGMLVAETDAPVIPCHIHGAFDALRPEAKWPRPKKITLRIGEPIRFRDTPNRKAGWSQVADTLRDAVTQLANQS